MNRSITFVIVAAIALSSVSCSRKNTAKIPTAIPSNNLAPTGTNPAKDEPFENLPSGFKEVVAGTSINFAPALTSYFDSQGVFMLSQSCVQLVQVSKDTAVIRLAARACTNPGASQPTLVTADEAIAEFGYQYSSTQDDVNYDGDIYFNQTLVGKFHSENQNGKMVVDSLCSTDPSGVCELPRDSSGKFTAFNLL